MFFSNSFSYRHLCLNAFLFVCPLPPYIECPTYSASLFWRQSLRRVSSRSSLKRTLRDNHFLVSRVKFWSIKCLKIINTLYSILVFEEQALILDRLITRIRKLSVSWYLINCEKIDLLNRRREQRVIRVTCRETPCIFLIYALIVFFSRCFFFSSFPSALRCRACRARNVPHFYRTLRLLDMFATARYRSWRYAY